VIKLQLNLVYWKTQLLKEKLNYSVIELVELPKISQYFGKR